MDTDRPGTSRAFRFLARAAHLTPAAAWDLADEPLLVGDVFPLTTPPPPPATPRPPVPELLLPWVSGDVDRPGARIRLRAKADGRHLRDVPAVRPTFHDWHEKWLAWSDRETEDRPARARHDLLLRAAELARHDRHDLLLGVGLLTTTDTDAEGRIGGGPRTLRRHLLTAPVVVDVGPDGHVRVAVDAYARGLTLDLRGVPAAHRPARGIADDLHAAARGLEGSPLDEEAVAPLLARIRAALPTPPSTAAPDLAWAPTLLVRRRGTVDPEPYRRLADRLEATPASLTHVPTPTPDPRPGAGPEAPDDLTTVADLTGPEGEALHHAVHHAETVIDTTGIDPTPLAAALVAHELREGRRVLVTGGATATLRAVHAHLPLDLRPLAVTVPDVAATDDDLTNAVETITRRFTDLDRDAVDRDLAASGRTLRLLRDERRRLLDQAETSREAETLVRTHGGHTAPLAELVRRHHDAAAEDGWLADLVDAPTDGPCPVDADDLRAALDLAGDEALARLARGFHGRRHDLARLPDPAEFARLVARFDEDAHDAAGRARYADDPAVRRLSSASTEDRARLVTLLGDLADDLCAAADFPGEWMEGAIRDLRSATPQEWHRAATVIGDLVATATEKVGAVGRDVDVVEALDHPAPRARYLRDHLREVGPLPVDRHGIPLGGIDLPDHVRAADPLFRFVRVDGRPPTRLEDVEAFLRHLDAERALDELDAAWPASTVVPEQDSLTARLDCHRTLWMQFDRIVALPTRLAAVTDHLATLGVPLPDWADDDAGGDLLARLAAADDVAATTAHAAPLTHLVIRLRDELADGGAADAARRLHDAVLALDPGGYAHAWEELAELDRRHDDLARRAAVVPRLRVAAPRLLDALDSAPRAWWEARLPRLEEAWRWACTRTWLDEQRRDDPTAFPSELARLDREIRDAAELGTRLAAWRHAVRADRLTPATRMALTLHTYLHRRLAGAGGSPRQYRELARIRRRCRAAVPAWLVTAHRVPDLFLDDPADRPVVDTVVVLDAAALDLGATFLRAVGPRIVLLGAPTPVTPATAGAADTNHADAWDDASRGHATDDPAARDLTTRRTRLAERYLGTERAGTWGDPTTSLFTEAVRRRGIDVRLRPEEDGGDEPPAPTSTASRLAAVLASRGYDVRTGALVEGRHLDLVVTDPERPSARLAIVCETSTWDGPEDHRRGLEHQCRIERHGWTVHRMRESELEIDPARAFAALRRVLLDQGLHPRDDREAPGAPDSPAPATTHHAAARAS
ncbi:hypothetical protein [Mobilicoccus pelagius]|uniref:Restriction endonuclease type II-like domain-containing protein n=1 Tax=Mobilicoccus pelagius NBRC 104925 TaxID=1089455 RepID=H5UVM8_9MICO|nr:hypothetical protein [Mobilicoccus pelagius]GAB49786.1 hypothetical protein MOPEL_135_00240 [Mobilicoccus pelagius NBRC 104925]